MKRLLPYAFLLMALEGCSSKTDTPKTAVEALAIAVVPIEAKTERVCKTLKVSGEIEAAESLTVYSKVTGKLSGYQVKKGSAVEKTDLLASIDRDEVGYSYNQAPILSPISGLVSLLPLSAGSEVRSDTPIASLVNIDSVKACFKVPERYRSSVRVGQSVEIHVDTLHTSHYTAPISEITTLIDPLSHTFSLEVQMDNPKKELIPGMYVSGEIVLEIFPESIMLPEEALVPIQGEWCVYTIASEQALLKKVKLGLRKQGKVQVLEGIAPGELVIVGGNHKVSEGQKVKIL